MPVFDFTRNIHDISRMKFNRFLSPLLIPASTIGYQKNLCTFVMNVPVVATSRFKRDIRCTDTLIFCKRVEVTVACEILYVSVIGLSQSE